MMALSTAPMPMKGRQFAKAIEKFDGWGSCSAVFVVSMTLSARNAASNSALQASSVSDHCPPRAEGGHVAECNALDLQQSMGVPLLHPVLAIYLPALKNRKFTALFCQIHTYLPTALGAWLLRVLSRITLRIANHARPE